WNLNHGIRDLQLYEIGKVYWRGGERRALILAATGALRRKTVHEPERDFNFYDVKGDVEDILNAFDLEWKSSVESIPAYYHPGRAMRDGDLAVFGELHADYAAGYKFRNRVYIAEMDFEMISAWNARRAIQPIPRFPSIRRD